MASNTQERSERRNKVKSIRETREERTKMNLQRGASGVSVQETLRN